MKSEKLTDTDIRALGWQALVEKLGPSGALRFALQTERGYGDYAKLRHTMLGSLSVDELLKRMKTRRKPTRRQAKRPRH